MTDVAATPTSIPEAGPAAGAGHTIRTRQEAAATTDTPEKRLSDLSFSVEKSLRYHHRRRGFFDAAHNVVMFGVLICGSAAFAGKWPSLAGAAAAILGALDLVFQFSHKARDHQQLYRRFAELNVDLQSIDLADVPALERATKRRLEIEADEPPIYWALDADCDNEVCVAWGKDKNAGLVELTKKQRLLMNFYRFDRAKFPDRKLA